MIARRTLLRHGAALLAPAALTAALPARAQGIDLAKILIGAPAGGAGDLMARRLAEKLRQAGYAGAVVVENRAGAGFISTTVPPNPGSTWRRCCGRRILRRICTSAVRKASTTGC